MAEIDLPKPADFKIEVLVYRVRDDGVVSSDFRPAGRCLYCALCFEEDEAVLRLRNHALMVDFVLHRRCVEALFRKAPKDGGDAVKEFERYRRKLVRRYSP